MSEDIGQWKWLRNATPIRARQSDEGSVSSGQKKVVEIVFDNGAVLRVEGVVEQDYDNVQFYQYVTIEPPPAKNGDWIVLKGDNDG